MRRPHTYHMALTLVTPNTGLPVTLASVKDVVAIPASDTSLDSLLTNYIKSARSFIEAETGRVLLSETWRLDLPQFPFVPQWPLAPRYTYALTTTPLLQFQEESRIFLPLAPVTAATVSYYDANNVLQTLVANTDYYLLTPTRLPASLTPARFWPLSYPRPNAVQITLTVGYSSLPDNCAQAIRALAATWFSYRESESEKVTRELNAGLQRIVEQLRVEL